MLTHLLDTNTVIYVIRRTPMEVRDRFIAHTGQLGISSITYAELTYGVHKSQQRETNRAALARFCVRVEILPYSIDAAEQYGVIRGELEARGQVIGPNDLHIAAHAKAANLTLVTNNLKEFERVEGLALENWIQDTGER
jgi:tRNA(fMet)-specific endonuclease VapC